MVDVIEERSEPLWYVRSQGRIWGPYPERRIADFVKEGRVAARTLISHLFDGPYAPAQAQRCFRHLFVAESELSQPLAVEGAVRTSEPTAPDSLLRAAQTAPLSKRPSDVSSDLTTGASAETVGAARPLVVIAALTTLEESTFEAGLAIHGAYERIGKGVWLIRARLGAAALRNALSRRLSGGDTLLVVEAKLDQAAWFNLGQAEEWRLRALWSA